MTSVTVVTLALVFIFQSLGFLWLIDRLVSRFERALGHGRPVENIETPPFGELKSEPFPLDEPRIEEDIVRAMPINDLLRKSGHGVSNDSDGDNTLPPLRESMQKGNLTHMNDGTRERIG